MLRVAIVVLAFIAVVSAQPPAPLGSPKASKPGLKIAVLSPAPDSLIKKGGFTELKVDIEVDGAQGNIDNVRCVATIALKGTGLPDMVNELKDVSVDGRSPGQKTIVVKNWLKIDLPRGTNLAFVKWSITCKDHTSGVEVTAGPLRIIPDGRIALVESAGASRRMSKRFRTPTSAGAEPLAPPKPKGGKSKGGKAKAKGGKGKAKGGKGKGKGKDKDGKSKGKKKKAKSKRGSGKTKTQKLKGSSGKEIGISIGGSSGTPTDVAAKPAL